VSSIGRRQLSVVLSSVSSDSHTWNLVYLQLLLEEQGYLVHNLGACVPDQVIVDAVRQHRPDALVISSVNGHGHLDGARMIRALRAEGDPEVAEVPAMIGGKLGIGGPANAHLADSLIAAGFTAVFTEGAAPQDFSQALSAAASAHRPVLAEEVAA
jgi:methylaspartate mutase sigma subunit